MELFDMDLTKKWATYSCISKKEVKKIIKNKSPREKTMEEIERESQLAIQLDILKRNEYLKRYKEIYGK